MKKFVVIKPPQSITDIDLGQYFKIFLAGTIENGTAFDWQENITKLLKETSSANKKIAIFNPRRDKWDASAEQTIKNIELKNQIEWELNAMDNADIIYMHLEKDSKSPITLLELGLYATSNKVIVNCPEGFYRKANVDIVCKKYNISNIENYEDSIDSLFRNL